MARPSTTHGRPAGHRSATAPYNFVRLPQQIMPATHLIPAGHTPWASHDHYLPGLHTGYLDCDITTLTPLFIGPAHLATATGPWHEPTRHSARRSFRLTPDGPPVIPGSSINGLLDTMIRILGFAHPNPRWDPTLWMRQPVAPTGDAAARRRKERDRSLRVDEQASPGAKPTPVAGFLRVRGKHNTKHWRMELLDTARHRPHVVRHHHLAAAFPDWTEPGNDPSAYQPRTSNPSAWNAAVHYVHCTIRTTKNGTAGSPHEVAVALAPSEDTTAVAELNKRPQQIATLARNLPAVLPDWLQKSVPPDHTITAITCGGIRHGLLVLTGTTGNKRAQQYLFPFPRVSQPTTVDIDKNVPGDVDSAEQITDYQKAQFPADDLSRSHPRPEDGRFIDGDPIWGEPTRTYGTITSITSLGRADGYRVRYKKKFTSLLPAGWETPGAGPDVCQALLGDVIPASPVATRKNLAAGQTTLRRRITAGHATLLPGQDTPEHKAVQIGLLQPHRGHYAHYLTQPDGGALTDLRDIDGHVGTGTMAEPRGFKLYPHHDFDPDPAPADEPGEWHEDIVLLRKGLTFRCRIRFTNLAHAELGLLLRALLLDNLATGHDSDNPVSAHKLGRGKPLGYGSVHITPTLHLYDTITRYRNTTNDAERTPPEPFLAHWDARAAIHAQTSDEELLPRTDWQHIARHRELALAHAWRDRLDPGVYAQMDVDAFREDKVLPGLLDLFDRRPR